MNVVNIATIDSPFIGTSTAGCLHVAEFPMEEVFGMIGRGHQWFDAAGDRYRINTDSMRYRLFARSRRCVCCGIEGTRLMLDVHTYGQPHPHFNLYAEQGELVLMTKDHIIPRSRGGRDWLGNFQTMCTECNKMKGCDFLTTIQLRRRLVA